MAKKKRSTRKKSVRRSSRQKNEDSKHVGLGLFSAICGILSLVTFPFAWPPVLFGLTAFILGILQMKHHRTTTAIVGIITGVLGMLLGFLILFAVMFIYAARSATLG